MENRSPETECAVAVAPRSAIEEATRDALRDALAEVQFLRVCLQGSGIGHNIIARQFEGGEGMYGWAHRQAAKDHETVQRQLATSRADFPFEGSSALEAAIRAQLPDDGRREARTTLDASTPLISNPPIRGEAG